MMNPPSAIGDGGGVRFDCRPSVNAYFKWRYISLLSGGFSM